MQPARDETSEHRGGGGIAMQSEPCNIWFAAGDRKSLVHRLDDVTTDRELAQRLLESRLQRPGRRADSMGESQAFEFLGAAKHQPAQFWISIGGARAQVGNASTFIIREIPQGPVETGPTLCVDLLFQSGLDLLFGSWSKFQGDAFGGTVAKAATDVSTTDHKILAIVGL